MNYSKLLATRVTSIEASGIRKIFDLAATVKDAVNLSIGHDWPVGLTRFRAGAQFANSKSSTQVRGPCKSEFQNRAVVRV